MVIDAKDTSTVVTGRQTGAPVRVLKNPMANHYLSMTKEGATLEELEKLTLGSLRKAVFEGDKENGSFMAGQIAGMIKEIKPMKQVMSELFDGVDSYKESLEVM